MQIELIFEAAVSTIRRRSLVKDAQAVGIPAHRIDTPRMGIDQSHMTEFLAHLVNWYKENAASSPNAFAAMAYLVTYSSGTTTARRLTEADRGAYERLCATHPSRLLTPRLHIDAFGLQSPGLNVWGAFAPGGRELDGLMFRLMNTAIVVDTDGATAAPFAEVIDSEAGMAGVRGSCEVMAGLRSHLRRHVCTNWEDSWFLRLDAPPACTRAAAARARRAREVDIDGLAALYGSAGAMYRTRENVASKVTTGRVFVVEEPGLAFGRPRIVSCALLNIEGHDAGLIGGVFTMPSARGRGCAAACTASLSLDLQADGKIPCLFYENPVAGRVYRRLGFTGGGHWAVFFLSPVRGSAVRAPHQ